jgi:hypothetical protein
MSCRRVTSHLALSNAIETGCRSASIQQILRRICDRRITGGEVLSLRDRRWMKLRCRKADRAVAIQLQFLLPLPPLGKASHRGILDIGASSPRRRDLRDHFRPLACSSRGFLGFKNLRAARLPKPVEIWPETYEVVQPGRTQAIVCDLGLTARRGCRGTRPPSIPAITGTLCSYHKRSSQSVIHQILAFPGCPHVEHYRSGHCHCSP